MYEITLICTIHKESGFSNISALYHIIENINPDIIFEEISQSDFNDYYRYKSKKRLETDTITEYLKNYQIKHIAVDYDYMPPESFFNAHQDMYNEIDKRSYDYQMLMDRNSQYIRQYGFKYLNSKYNDDIWEKIKIATEETLLVLNNKKYFQIYKSWNDLMEKRELEIINNVYCYCMENEFNKGILYIGSGHRNSIINKIEKHKECEVKNIIWNYHNYDGIL